MAKFFLNEEELYKQILLKNEKIWNNRINKKVIKEWLGNFKGELFEEQYEHELALWLLVNFVFYNESEVRDLCKNLFAKFTHLSLLADAVEQREKSIEQRVENILERTRFYQLGKPGESGAYILYYFRQENDLSIENFVDISNNLSETVDTIVFIDDVTISSEQAGKYINKSSDFGDRKKILLTFIATEFAEQELAKIGIQVLSCIKLDDRNKCFSDKSNVFYEIKEHLENARNFAQYYGLKAWDLHPLGFADGQYYFGFFYNVPDNTLPIFWSEMNGWIPVIKRYHKKYKGGLSSGLGIFI